MSSPPPPPPFPWCFVRSSRAELASQPFPVQLVWPLPPFCLSQLPKSSSLLDWCQSSREKEEEPLETGVGLLASLLQQQLWKGIRPRREREREREETPESPQQEEEEESFQAGRQAGRLPRNRLLPSFAGAPRLASTLPCSTRPGPPLSRVSRSLSVLRIPPSSVCLPQAERDHFRGLHWHTSSGARRTHS